MQRIEAREGRPMDELLRELYVERGLTLEQVGAELNPTDPITKGAVSRWLERFGIDARRSGPERSA